MTRTRLTDAETINLAPQTRLVYDTLATGRGLTVLVAMTTLGVASLTKRISELRALGLDVRDETRVDHRDKRYKRYWLAQV